MKVTQKKKKKNGDDDNNSSGKPLRWRHTLEVPEQARHLAAESVRAQKAPFLSGYRSKVDERRFMKAVAAAVHKLESNTSVHSMAAAA